MCVIPGLACIHAFTCSARCWSPLCVVAGLICPPSRVPPCFPSAASIAKRSKELRDREGYLKNMWYAAGEAQIVGLVCAGSCTGWGMLQSPVVVTCIGGCCVGEARGACTSWLAPNPSPLTPIASVAVCLTPCSSEPKRQGQACEDPAVRSGDGDLPVSRATCCPMCRHATSNHQALIRATGCWACCL